MEKVGRRIAALAIITGFALGCRNPMLGTDADAVGDAASRAALNGSLQQEAETWSAMAGVQTEGCSEGGLNVGWIDSGDWIVYPLTVGAAGTYRVSYRVASPNSGKYLSADLAAGATQLGTVAIPNTGSWQSWTTVSHDVYLPAGNINFGLNAGSGGFNVNWISFAAQGPGPVVPANLFFDDFIYASPTDAAFTGFGWLVRSWAGKPGPAAVNAYSAANVSFVSGPVNKALRLTGRISGGVVSQAELNFKESKMLEGTYAARIYLTDGPDSGADGAYVNHAPFWTMSNYSSTSGTDLYSELDFEYLPNGGWGYYGGPAMYNTTWYNDVAGVNQSTVTKESFSGWRTLVIQVSGGRVKYYLGSRLLADHGQYYPRSKMQILPQIWFIEANVDSVYHNDTDWCLYAQNTVLSAAQAESLVTTLRNSGVQRRNTVQ